MIVKVRDARYAGTIYESLPRLPQVAFAGRSNVGKSSLINALLNRKSLVKTSKQPGKTRNINFFEVDLVDLPSLYLVDLPGYGYARVPQGMKSAWEKLAARYFRGNEDLRLLMVLLDIRRDPGKEEFMVLDLARSTGARPLIAATKADKLTFSARARRVKEIARLSGAEPIPVSVVSREGVDAIWECILREIAPG
ncbi:MAG: ribosome biogenesis GTP-binding protein YihA/YsxC [Desulfomonilia bacterium]|jgi:GTP-binding protein|uniref:Putative GTP-binding protein EngB n=1 Tax=anaerobic digester metagenome TaxID=1263854 RepID=A0A485M973_9ZZZZ|nr:ribosome biogenesis GTP-binding protein YihA/YsxC [Pseudomonadota bacterium]HON38652.1 ribosome biogenesis GTP-binding protein YihA/YsxC [Deltaproteobacteria bacterium]HRS55956.1 ribosome biogenesis GTP-binding protein YihA/YsxC [Desulfomonilia bacterium]HPD21860.1 ribosome biogenesis GTP-binding protein YihA/YsxC [Deltaproteobacteria bacterium]HPX17881.1 ribosome biogenesis GTP-binding protein YihA/YsxC [Deltaproteobacteria bacterium]